MNRQTVLTGSLLLALQTVAVSPQATAGEMIAMPFACSVTRDGLSVEAAGERRYPIVGDRKRLRARSCSKSKPDECRSWVLERFDVQCGDKIVAWADLRAALQPAPPADMRYIPGYIFFKTNRGWVHAPRRLCRPVIAGNNVDPHVPDPLLRRCLDEYIEPVVALVVVPTAYAPVEDSGARLVADESPENDEAPDKSPKPDEDQSDNEPTLGSDKPQTEPPERPSHNEPPETAASSARNGVVASGSGGR